MRNAVLALAVIAAIGLFVITKTGRPSASDSENQVATATPVESPAAEQSPATLPPAETQESIAKKVEEAQAASSQRAALNTITPTPQTLRDDIAKDPHKTPESMIRFAVELGHRMEDAKKSKTYATHFLDELEACTLAQENDTGIRAVCLSHAKRLATKYPDFQSRVEGITRRTDADVTRLLQ